MTYGCDKGLGRIRPKLTLPLPQLRPSLTRFKGSATQGQPNSPIPREFFSNPLDSRFMIDIGLNADSIQNAK